MVKDRVEESRECLTILDYWIEETVIARELNFDTAGVLPVGWMTLVRLDVSFITQKVGVSVPLGRTAIQALCKPGQSAPLGATRRLFASEHAFRRLQRLSHRNIMGTPCSIYQSVSVSM
jgi:hypothetical protein